MNEFWRWMIVTMKALTLVIQVALLCVLIMLAVKMHRFYNPYQIEVHQ